MHLDKTQLSDLANYLQHHELINAHDVVVYAEKPGEGNMNYTLRVRTKNGQSLVTKQARPYVEKYPSIPAPEERILVESEFYKTIADNDFLRAHTPEILLTDKENYILVMEDLGTASDYTLLYKKGNNLSVSDAELCAAFIHQLHSNYKNKGKDLLMDNSKLKALNHEHIFVYPFLGDNGFDLDLITPGLQASSMPYKNDNKLKELLNSLGETYLSTKDTLLHGDYYPGSWLNTEKGLVVIDPEFAFYGKAEFDLGVLFAHLYLAQQPDEVFKTIDANYLREDSFDEALFNAFTGVEIMRRIIGLAQLPLELNLKEKEELLQEAYNLIS
ncbi:phosphotransferase [Daejeonella sp.]|uniref:phosphotransferase n=1 Tax=Daejeonella sp. TaxID=2805397 RepID=UPI003982F1BD